MLYLDLYSPQSAFLRVGDLKSDACVIGRGVREGCTLSPLPFNLYNEAMMREATRDEDNGVKVAGCLVNSLRFAEHKAIIGKSVKGL